MCRCDSQRLKLYGDWEGTRLHCCSIEIPCASFRIVEMAQPKHGTVAHLRSFLGRSLECTRILDVWSHGLPGTALTLR